MVEAGGKERDEDIAGDELNGSSLDAEPIGGAGDEYLDDDEIKLELSDIIAAEVKVKFIKYLF